jgi:outer membrane lipoprotein LolB
MRHAVSLAFVAMLGGTLAACAAIAPVSRPPVAVPAEEAFGIDGRLSARHGTQAVAAHFAWTHAAPRDELVVATPLGQTIAELAGDVSVPHVEVRMADGRREEARDWTELTTRSLGFALPVAWLSAWVRGAPHADAPHAIEVDAFGRASVLRQNGWEVVYGYADESSRLPTRLRLAYPDVDIAIVVDRWHP